MKRILSLFILGLSFLFLMTGCANAELEIVIPKIGAADSILLNLPDQAVLIDTGEEDDSQEILGLIRQRGIQELDALILTHFDKDHIGGAAEILKQLPVKTVYLPAYEKGGKLYKALNKAMLEQGVETVFLSEDTNLTIGALSLSILTAKQEHEDDNNNSLAIACQYHEKRFLFAGDAEAERIEELLSYELNCDILKLPHHGRYNDNSEALLRATGADIGIICSSDKSPADEAVLNLMDAVGMEAYETRFGDIRIVTDGKRLAIHP